MPAPSRASLAGVVVGDGFPVVVMGALNVSPESFYSGSVRRDEELLRTAQTMVEAGASIIDVGAMSTAPYLRGVVSEDEERERLSRAVRSLAQLGVPISADTSRVGPALAAIDAGARIINDVTGLADARLARLAADRDVSLLLMASPAAFRVPDAVEASGPIAFVRRALSAVLARVDAAGIPRERVVLDPGIGFFLEDADARARWDVTVLSGLAALADLGRPLAVGVSRKSFIGTITGRKTPDDRLAGSLAATTIAVLEGGTVVRTHDVAETVDAIRLAERACERRQRAPERRERAPERRP